MLALARDLPAANASTQAGKWEKNRFMGVEITGKVLGLIGAGNIGSIVADRARGLHMRVIAYDPFLSEERAQEMGVEKVALNDLLARADFITLHVPMTPETKNILSAEALARTKKGVRIINCARGGLIDEQALKAAIDSGGHVAGAALDVFEVEPAKENILFNNEKVVATPHLGASTSEAQENVALQVAEQISDYLLTGAITNALNMPSISASEAQKVRPWISLSEKLGSFAGQLTGSSLTAVEIIYEGTAATLNTRALTQAALAGLLKPMLSEVNMVNAPVVAKERGIKVSETRRDAQGIYEGYIKIVVTMGDSTRRVAGTVFSDGRPRLIQVKDINLDAEFAPHMLYVVNEDKPGFIGKFGTLLGEAKVNIANFTLGRSAPGQDAIALIEVDGQVPDSVIDQLAKLPLVKMAKALAF